MRVCVCARVCVCGPAVLLACVWLLSQSIWICVCVCVDSSLSLSLSSTGEVLSSRCSPLPLRASLVSSSSTSSFRQALSSSRPVSSLSPVSPVTPITPVTALPDRGLASNGQRTSRHEQQQVERRLHLDLANLGLQDQEEEPLNREEVSRTVTGLPQAYCRGAVNRSCLY